MQSNTGKDVLIIGNGFDLNLGLRTSYRHFIDSDCYAESGMPGTELGRFLYSHWMNNTWFDIENLLSVYSKKSEPISSQSSNLYSNFTRLGKTLTNYLRSIDYKNIQYDLTGALGLLTSLNLERRIILDFNYTSTFRHVAQRMGIKYDPSDHIKVHGDTEHGIIFGVADRADIRPEHIFLKKAYNKHYKTCNFYDLLSRADCITVIGYSFGDMDHTYFENFFMGQRDIGCKHKFIDITYYGEESYMDIMKQLDRLTRRSLTGLKQLNTLNMIDLRQN